jgi:sugar O-acyltransferase (sialic acid O-acetyltransferase NeuD family)
VPAKPEDRVKRKLFIFGVGNFAEMAHHLFTTDSSYDVAGFTVDSAYLDRRSFKGLPVVAYEQLRESADRSAIDVFVAVGVGRINTLRAQKVADIEADGFRLASFVSSQARVPPGFVARPNTMIMDQVNIHPMVEVGADTVIWSNSRIALKVRIGDHVWITSAVIGDSTTIGDYSFIGLNATVAPFVHVGSHNLIGAAAVILRDTKNYEVYKGPRSTPSKVSSLRIKNIPLIR